MEFGIQFFPDVGPEIQSAEDYWREALALTDHCDELGYTNVMLFQAGYPAWKAAYGAGPTAGKAMPPKAKKAAFMIDTGDEPDTAAPRPDTLLNDEVIRESPDAERADRPDLVGIAVALAIPA